MAVVGVVISSVDGMVVAADTPPGASGAANDTILSLNARTVCYVWNQASAAVLQAFIAATNPMPASPLQVVQAMSGYLTATPPAQPPVGFDFAGVEPGPAGGNTVIELSHPGAAAGGLKQMVFPGDLYLGSHSIGRYLNARMFGAMKIPMELAQRHAAFVIGETRLALPTVRPHVAMARIDRVAGLSWATDADIAELTNEAFERSRKLWLKGIDLF